MGKRDFKILGMLDIQVQDFTYVIYPETIQSLKMLN